MMIKYISKLLVASLLIIFSASSFAQENNNNQYDYNYATLTGRCQPYDPYEALNRKIFVVNSILDAFFLRPVSKGYERFTNDYTKHRVENFIYNIHVPLSTVNYGFQGNRDGVLKSFWRFAINSTFGVAGLFDIASKFDLNPPAQTFTNVLAYYGVGQGPYIVLPIYGGMGARDLPDTLFLDSALNIVKYPMHRDFKHGLTAAKMIHDRAKILPFTDYVSKNSPDPYIAVRDSILQQREARVTYPANFRCPEVN